LAPFPFQARLRKALCSLRQVYVTFSCRQARDGNSVDVFRFFVPLLFVADFRSRNDRNTCIRLLQGRNGRFFWFFFPFLFNVCAMTSKNRCVGLQVALCPFGGFMLASQAPGCALPADPFYRGDVFPGTSSFGFKPEAPLHEDDSCNGADKRGARLLRFQGHPRDRGSR